MNINLYFKKANQQFKGLWQNWNKISQPVITYLSLFAHNKVKSSLRDSNKENTYRRS